MIFIFFSTRNANKDRGKTRIAESLFWRQLEDGGKRDQSNGNSQSQPPSDSSGRAGGAAEGEGGRALMCESEKI